jgi:hypothetical protein
MKNVEATWHLNSEGHALLLDLEIGLREIAINLMKRKYGPAWTKSKLPADVAEKAKKGKHEEKKARWLDRIDCHPLYYCDFPDLLKVIIRSDNWSDVFEAIFARKEIITGELQSIEPVRNKIAHHRPLTLRDIEKLRSAHAFIESCTADDARPLAAYKEECTCTIIPRALERLRDQLEFVKSSIVERVEIELDNIPSISWWLSDEVLDHDVSEITSAVRAASAYASEAPRGRGKGHHLDRWIAQHAPVHVFEKAISVISCILEIQDA